MNTVNLNSNSNRFFGSREKYMEFRAAWKSACKNKDIRLTAVDYALYALLRGRNLNSQFSPIINLVKLKNGQAAYEAMHRAIREIFLACGFAENGLRFAKLYPYQEQEIKKRKEALLALYDGLVSEDMLMLVCECLRQDDSYAASR